MKGRLSRNDRFWGGALYQMQYSLFQTAGRKKLMRLKNPLELSSGIVFCTLLPTCESPSMLCLDEFRTYEILLVE
jgi:hypothetical protein